MTFVACANRDMPATSWTLGKKLVAIHLETRKVDKSKSSAGRGFCRRYNLVGLLEVTSRKVKLVLIGVRCKLSHE